MTLQIEFLPEIKKDPFQRSRWRRSAGICWPRRSCAAEIGLAFRRRRSQAPGRDSLGCMRGDDVWRQATSGPLRALVELADFEVVGHTISFSARHDGGRAHRGAASKSAAAGANAGLVLAAACALHARLCGQCVARWAPQMLSCIACFDAWELWRAPHIV